MNKITGSPLTDEQQEQFSKLFHSLNTIQLAWLSGYLAANTALGKSDALPSSAPIETKKAQEETSLTILYGSRTGNGESLAKKALELSSQLGIKASLKNMADYSPRNLQSEKNLLVIVSTHGEGEPPFAAKELHSYIFGKRAPKLQNLNFAVLGLGDSSYLQFCQTGKDFDSQLEKLGGKRVVPISTCDVDFENQAFSWLQTAISAFNVDKSEKQSDNIQSVTSNVSGSAVKHSRANPFSATILEKINLHGRGSGRQTIHLELQTDESVAFVPGDAAGVMPVNSSELVQELLKTSGLSAEEVIQVEGKKQSLSNALTHEFELSKLTTDVVTRYQQFSGDKKLGEILANPSKLFEYVDGRDVVDLLTDFPTQVSSEKLSEILRKLQPRFYSIASSPLAFPDELHLTVGVVEFNQNGRNKRGTCSTYLSGIDTDDDQVPLFIQSNPDFRLPSDNQTPIIMVGAGTGIAPYRSFIQHREALGNAGKSWLFFGNRNFETEFLYQTEWQKYIKSGTLTKMDVAFSRDSTQKVYVQHKLEENAPEVYRWLEDGAHFYVCGDMKKMAKDVQETLTKIVSKEGKLSKDDASEYINRLQKERRLQLDIY